MNQALAFPINGDREAANWAPQRFRYWYDNIIDLLLAEPQLTQKDIAQRLGRHAATIGMIMNSDLFRARYEQRRGAQSAALTEAINTKLSRVTIQALELTEETLEKKRTAVPLPELVDIADKALARLGYGPRTSSAPGVNVQVNGMVLAPLTPEQLASSRAKLVEAQAKSVESPPTTPSTPVPAGVDGPASGKEE